MNVTDQRPTNQRHHDTVYRNMRTQTLLMTVKCPHKIKYYYQHIICSMVFRVRYQTASFIAQCSSLRI